jgi:hypothetical protein
MADKLGRLSFLAGAKNDKKKMNTGAKKSVKIITWHLANFIRKLPCKV